MNESALMDPASPQKLAAEFVGSMLLLATVVGSGIMGERLAGGNPALALLANSIATGCALYALITMFAPLSGAHFNPAVTMVEFIAGRMLRHTALLYLVAQIAGTLAGVVITHFMFELPLIFPSQHPRSGGAQWFSEFVAAFGLLTVILHGARAAPDRVAAMVACYITAAYWFTASTSFANPAMTIARSLTDTFVGIRAVDAPMFILMQLLGTLVALVLFKWMTRPQ